MKKKQLVITQRGVEVVRRKSFVVTVDIPEDVTDREMKDYILDSVQTMKGSLHPEDPIFEMEHNDFKVVYFRSKRYYA